MEAFGVDLSPVAALLPRLVVAEERQTWEADEHRRLTRELPAAWRRVRAGLAWAVQNSEPGDAAAEAVWEEFQSTKPRTRAETPLEVLEARLETLACIDARLAALCDEPAGGPPSGPARSPDVENDCETSDLSPDMSAGADMQSATTRLYRVHVGMRKSLGDMTRKSSDTSSHKVLQFLGTFSFKNPSTALQKSLKVA